MIIWKTTKKFKPDLHKEKDRIHSAGQSFISNKLIVRVRFKPRWVQAEGKVGTPDYRPRFYSERPFEVRFGWLRKSIYKDEHGDQRTVIYWQAEGLSGDGLEVSHYSEINEPTIKERIIQS